jgi:hypothetical protein
MLEVMHDYRICLCMKCILEAAVVPRASFEGVRVHLESSIAFQCTVRSLNSTIMGVQSYKFIPDLSYM